MWNKICPLQRGHDRQRDDRHQQRRKQARRDAEPEYAEDHVVLIVAEHLRVHVIHQRVERGNDRAGEQRHDEVDIRPLGGQDRIDRHVLLQQQRAHADKQAADGRRQHPQQCGGRKAVLDHLLHKGAEEADEEAVDRPEQHGADQRRQRGEGQLDAADLHGEQRQAEVHGDEHRVNRDAADGETGLGHKKFLLRFGGG